MDADSPKQKRRSKWLLTILSISGLLSILGIGIYSGDAVIGIGVLTEVFLVFVVLGAIAFPFLPVISECGMSLLRRVSAYVLLACIMVAPTATFFFLFVNDCFSFRKVNAAKCSIIDRRYSDANHRRNSPDEEAIRYYYVTIQFAGVEKDLTLIVRSQREFDSAKNVDISFKMGLLGYPVIDNYHLSRN